MGKICRICLKSFEKQEELKLIFENDDDNIKIAKKIYDISGVFIEKNYNTPEKICKLCNKTLNISYQFRLLCQQSDIKLKSLDYNDEFYIKHILENIQNNGDISTATTLKVEPDSEILQSLLEDDAYQNEEDNSNDYQDYEIIADEDYEIPTNDEFTSELPSSNTINDQVDLIINESMCKEQNWQEDVENEFIEVQSYDHLLDKTDVKFNKTRKKVKDHNGKFFYTFKTEFVEKYDFLEQGNDNRSALCTICNCQIALGYKGEGAITRHIKTTKHISNSKNYVNEEIEQSNKGENVHICDICGNKYSTLHMLKRHIKYHSDVMDYECEICQKKFRQMMQLKRHMRIHTGEKPYSCKYCNKAIRDYSTKIRHERIHTGERPYVCQTCNKGFQYPFVLKNHQKIHTGEKLYECVICNKNFTLKKHLSSHLDTMLHKSRAEKFEQNHLEVEINKF